MQVLDRFNSRGITTVRLVGEAGNEIVQIQEAFRRASDVGLDLILVGADSSPPVVRIQDFKKLQYEQKKSRKPTKSSDLKEIQLKVNITDHDLGTKISAIQRFLERGDKVKVSVRLKGRERESPERAHLLIDKVTQKVTCKVTRIPGPGAIVLLENR